ncbi:MAG: hypothetical protein GMKNLPBB_01677 [Myxococcota bacterium]|nr:hypothetical protein [Myxococcota bacterium]
MRLWPQKFRLRGLLSAGLLPAAALAVWPGLAFAVDPETNVENVEKGLSDMDSRLTFVREQYINLQNVAEQESASAMLEDAKRALKQKAFIQAAIYSHDLYEGGKLSGGERVDALYVLSEALYQYRNYRGAKAYFNELLRNGGGKYRAESLGRLIEIADITRRYEELPALAQQIPTVDGEEGRSGVWYLMGRAQYNQRDYLGCMRAMGSVSNGTSRYLQSRYFLGLANVQLKQLDKALEEFETISKHEAKNATERDIRDLAILGKGRVLYEQGKYPEAQAAYSSLAKDSKHRLAGLYELAWAYVRNNNFDKAQRVMELYVITSGFSSQDDPSIQLVRAKLLVRQNQFEDATVIYGQVRREYGPLRDEIVELTAQHSDPESYFNKVVGRTNELKVDRGLPQPAINAANENPSMRFAMRVFNEIDDSRKEIAKSLDTVDHLLRTVEGKNAVELFPREREGKSILMEIDNNLALYEGQLTDAEFSLLEKHMSDSERDEVLAARKRRAAVTGKFSTIPNEQTGFYDRQGKVEERILGIQTGLYAVQNGLRELRVEILAIEEMYNRYMRESSNPNSVNRQAEIGFKKRLDDEKKYIEWMLGRAKEMEGRIVSEKRSLGLGSAESDDENIRENYIAALRAERALMTPARNRADSSDLAVLRRIEAARSRARELHVRARQNSVTLDEVIRRKGVPLKADLLRYKGELNDYDKAYEAQQAQTEKIAGDIAYRSLQKVKEKYENIMLQSEYGIADVAGRKHELITSDVNELQKQKQRELRNISEDFREIVSEEGEGGR